jgi:endonuclease YncB( thermonuclease family)
VPKPPAHSTYQKLVSDISRLYQDAKKAQVRFAWETGRRIVEVEQDGEVKAKYGSGLLQNLSDELSKRLGPGFSIRTLRDMRRFYLVNKIRQPAAELGWSNQVALMRVKDPKRRKSLEALVVREGLVKDKVRELVRKETAKTSDDPGMSEVLPPLKRPIDLKLHTYKKSGVDIDCGFFIYYPATKDDLAGITITDKPSYTYAATVERVVDGDTLRVVIEVGFGIRLREKLRLAHVNCPELGTPAGESAKRFVMKALPAGSNIVIKSQKDDKYGRFVADVFYLPATGERGGFDEIIASGTYLNQELLDKGLAVRYA